MNEYLVAYDAAVMRFKTWRAWSAVLGRDATIRWAHETHLTS